MTILANEIRIGKCITDVILIQVADSRITRPGKKPWFHRKVFEIRYLNALVGYFGLAEPRPDEYFSSWLPNTITHGHKIKSINEFAQYLTDKLNEYVPKTRLKNNPSGFHVCGLSEDGIPEFYYIRNIIRRDGPYYKEFKDSYYFTEDFRNRDAITTEDGKQRSLTSLHNMVFWYVNGDLRNFWDFWIPATKFIDAVSLDPDFPALKSDLERAKWKLKTIAALYKYRRTKIVGGKIYGFEIKPKL
jgi:hypothetical protein